FLARLRTLVRVRLLVFLFGVIGVRRGVGGVVGVAVGRLAGGGGGGGGGAGPPPGIGLSSAGGGPLLELPLGAGGGVAVHPLVGAHDEQADERLPGDAVVDALEPVVEPTQVGARQVEEGGRAEVALAVGAPRLVRVPPGPQDELLRAVLVAGYPQVV